MELEKLLKQLVEIKKTINQLQEVEKKLREKIQEQLEDKVEVDGATISPQYRVVIKPKREIEVKEIYGKYDEALKIDYRKLYEIADDDIKGDLEKEVVKSIVIRLKK